MRDEQRTTNEQLKIELLSQWKLEAESRNSLFYILHVLFLFLVQSFRDEAFMIRFSYWPFCFMTQKIGDV